MAASGQAHLPACSNGSVAPSARLAGRGRGGRRLASVRLGGIGRRCAAGSGAGGPANGRRAGLYVLTADSTGGDYAPTFTGNGYIGIRVPPAGQGYAAEPVPIIPPWRGSTPGRPARCSSGPTCRLVGPDLLHRWGNGLFPCRGPGDRMAATARFAGRCHHHDGDLDGARWSRHRSALYGIYRPGPAGHGHRPAGPDPALERAGDGHRSDGWHHGDADHRGDGRLGHHGAPVLAGYPGQGHRAHRGAGEPGRP